MLTGVTSKTRLQTVIRVVVWTVAAAFVCLALWQLTVAFRGFGANEDFDAYWDAAHRLRDGEALYTVGVDESFTPGPYGLYLYAPPLALLVVPLTALSFETAASVWLVAKLVALGFACAAMPVQRWIRYTTFGVALVQLPVLLDLALGNVSILLFCLFVPIWRWHSRPAGGLALATAISIRPSMGLLLIALVVRRQWRAVLLTVAGGLALILLTLPVTGVGTYVDFVRVLTHVTGVRGIYNNFELGSTLGRLGVGDAVAWLATGAATVTALVALGFALRRDLETLLVVSFGASIVLNPLMWDHYLINLLAAGAFLAGRGHRWAIALPLLVWVHPVMFPVWALAGTVLPLLAKPVATAPDLEGRDSHTATGGGAAHDPQGDMAAGVPGASPGAM